MHRLRSLKRSIAVRLGNYIHRALPAWGLSRVDKGTQILLALRYRELIERGAPPESFRDVGFRAYSQNEEDGILLYLFSILGTVTRRAVEICAEDGIESNAANLIINHGWDALLFDGSPANIKRGTRFYARHPDTWMRPPRLVRAWIKRETVNDLIRQQGFSGEIDLLSLDIDGVDYWVWRELTAVSPRVVVVEYRDAWGPHHAVTVPYSPDFDRANGHPEYWGASLNAFVKLGREKGYRLVGCNRYCSNAFFVRGDVGAHLLPEVDPIRCTNYPDFKSPEEAGLPAGAKYAWTEV